MSIEGYQLTLGIHEHDEGRFERGHFIKQLDLDPFNCGPIACTKILEMLHLTSDYEVKLEIVICYKWYLRLGCGQLEKVHTTIGLGPRSACERASSIMHTSRGEG